MERQGEGAGPELPEQAARALVDRGTELVGQGQSEAAIEAFEQVVRHCGGAAEPRLRALTAQSLLGMASALGVLGRWKAAVVACEEVERRCGEALDPELRALAAMALVSKGLALQHEPPPTKAAIAAFDQVVATYEDDPALQFRVIVAAALVCKADALALQGQLAAAVAAYDLALERYGGATEAELRETLARARQNRAQLG